MSASALTLLQRLVRCRICSAEALAEGSSAGQTGEVHDPASDPGSCLIVHPGGLLLRGVVPQEALLAVLVDAGLPLAVGLVPDDAPIPRGPTRSAPLQSSALLCIWTQNL